MKQRDKENLNPSAEAVFAMRHWPSAYASQNGGSMDFYLDYLSDRDRRYCVEAVQAIVAAWQKTQPSSTPGASEEKP